MDLREGLLHTFFAESAEILADLERAALALAEERDDSRLEEIYRQVHTLKGNASCVSFEAVMRACHALEDVMAAATNDRRGSDPALVGLLLEGIDTIARLVADASAGVDEPENPAIEVLQARSTAWIAGTTALTHRPAGPQPVAESDVAARARTIRVEVERLDRAMELAGGLTIARGRLVDAIAHKDLARAGAAAEMAEQLIRDLEARILELRLVPLKLGFERMRRVVRDLGQSIGKDVRFELHCGEVEVDVAVAEALRAPLTHVLRNAVDHGIESAAVRVAAGKPRQGRISLSARQQGGYLIVELSDDGAGMDRDRLRARAAAMGLAVEGLADHEVLELAFVSGLSTAERVGSLSGRGIGMDVVRSEIESLRGSVQVRTAPGAGVTVTMRLPLALSIIQGLAVDVGDEVFVVPLDNVVECVELDHERAVRSREGGVLELRGEALPYLGLGARLGGGALGGPRPAVVVVEHDGRRAGLEVDDLRGEVQAVIKPIGRLFERVQGIAGSAVLNDGRLALVIDVQSLMRGITKGVTCSPSSP